MSPYRYYIQKGLLFLFGSSLFLFVLTKSMLSSFTIDESYTYLHYPHDSFIDIISFSSWFTNNHILNSLFMKYSELLFGNSELALRLPNLILMLVYMLYSYLFFKQENFILACSLFILLCSNSVMLNFFGLARGYGMSCGFMLMSLYHYLNYVNENKKKHLYLFHFAALLATLSHFSVLVFYVALLLIYNPLTYLQLTQVKGEKYNFLKANKAHIIPLLLVAMFLFEPLRRLAKTELDFGGKSGFYEDTVNALIYNTFQYTYVSPTALGLLQIVFTLTVLIPLFIIFKNLLQHKTGFFTQHQALIVTTFLTSTIPCIIVLQHVLRGTDYPGGRFSIFLFPLLVIHIGFLMRYVMAKGQRVAALSLLLCMACFSLVALYNKGNVHSYGEWGFDCETKQMIMDLNQIRKTDNDTLRPVKLGVSWLFEPTTNFYRETRGLTWLIPVNRGGISEEDDYCYLFKNELGTLKNQEYRILKTYNCENTLLLRRIKKP